jgi:hypothetical protein
MTTSTPQTVKRPTSSPSAPLIGSALAIEIETLEYAAHLCHQCDGLSVQAAWKIEAIIKRLSSQNTKLSGGGPLSNKTTEAESRRPLE